MSGETKKTWVDFVATDDMTTAEAFEKNVRILTATRTGKKAHIGSPGSSVTFCGHWLKFNANQNRVRIAQITDERQMCEKCVEYVECYANASWMETVTASNEEV